MLPNIKLIKTKSLELITKLPNAINLPLMLINTNPNIIYGKKYQLYKSFLFEHRAHYNQGQSLIGSVNRSLSEVPYYKRLYKNLQIYSIEEFKNKIQFIDKDIILENYDEFISQRINKNDYDSGTTGGTSGKPLRLIAPRDRYIVEIATMHSLWKNAGYNFHVRGVIRNHRINGKDYIINPITREIIFDGFRLEEEYFETIYRLLKKWHVSFIHCYPSTAYEFSLFLLQKKYDISFIRAFLSGSENIFDYQRDLIEVQLGVRFYNWYGHSEKLVLAGYCEKTNNYHIEPTYGYFELINENGKTINNPGETGEIVGTSFHNPGMPLIRYRTGDYAEYIGDYCPACNRHVPIIGNIKGRWNGDRIYNSDGSFITTTALNLHSDLYNAINGLQYIQKSKGELEVLVIKSNHYNEDHEKTLYNHFKSKLKSDIKIKLHYVNKLKKMPNGKCLHLISSIGADDKSIINSESKEHLQCNN
jgi:phenylacetate-CoA ligase